MPMLDPYYGKNSYNAMAKQLGGRLSNAYTQSDHV